MMIVTSTASVAADDVVAAVAVREIGPEVGDGGAGARWVRKDRHCDKIGRGGACRQSRPRTRSVRVAKRP